MRTAKRVLCDAFGGTEELVERWLVGALAAGAAAWPGVRVSEDAYVAHLVAHVGPDATLADLHSVDLYLAAACGLGAPTALSLFDATYSNDIVTAIRRVARSAETDELVQQLRESLFVGREDRPPKILDYSGRGPLRAWVRVVATRGALNAATRGPKERLAFDEDAPLLEGRGLEESPELAYLRLNYEAEVKAALPAALGALSRRERLLLRQHYIDQLTLEELARLHAVHVATVKRHLAAAREAFTESLRALLRDQLKLSPSELESVLALVRSRLHVTMDRLLATDLSSATEDDAAERGATTSDPTGSDPSG